MLDQAHALVEKAASLTKEALSEAFKALPKEVQSAYRKMRKAAYFVPENANVEARKEHVSPSGKYKLVVTPFATSPGSWSYSQGLVYAIGSDTPMAEVQRNYGSFPFSWVENHPKGDFLVCGEDYQGQTVIELDTGARRDHLPTEAGQGVGFCWVQHRYDAASKLLVVAGCVWACPYEFQFYDFSDPMAGWPMLKVIGDDGDETYIDDDDRWPEFGTDGSIKCFDTMDHSDDDDDDEDETEKPATVNATKAFKREGLQLVLVEEWVSEEEKARRIRREESNRKYEAWKAEFKTTDPLYLTTTKLEKEAPFTPASHDSIGFTYKGWCPDETVSETRWCREIARKSKDSIEVEWGVKVGPIKLCLRRDGKVENQFFEHSAEGMEKAFAYARTWLGGAS
jgi:hypothetical protein